MKRALLGRASPVLLALVVAYLYFEPGCQVLTAPWSVGFGGKPTLTGSWVGVLRSLSGARLPLYLDLQYTSVHVYDEVLTTNLAGRARVCNRHGDIYDYQVTGTADWWTGATQRIGLGPPQGLNHPGLGLRGRWDTDILTVSGQNPFHPATERVGLVDSRLKGDDPILGHLRRGGEPEHLAACSQVAASES